MLLAVVFTTTAAMAQKTLDYPYQGGQEAMNQFFNNNFVPSAEIKQARAAGTVTLKFTADPKGAIKKIIVYYADDLSLVQPVADLIKKTDKKWIIFDGEKMHDYIITFAISYNTPQTGAATANKAYTTFYARRTPIFTNNQVPLDMATLLPTVALKYDLN